MNAMLILVSTLLLSVFSSFSAEAKECSRRQLARGCETSAAFCTTIPATETCIPIVDENGNYLGENCIGSPFPEEICHQASCHCPRRERPEAKPPQNGRRYAAYNRCMRQNRHITPVSRRIEKCRKYMP